MALDIATGAKPAFLRKNWVNSDSQDYGTLTSSEMSSIIERIIDGDKDSRWNSSNSTDGTSVSITVDFRELETLASRSIDFILLQNINVKNFLIEESTTGSGGPWTTVTGGDYQSGTADFSGTDFQLALASQLTGRKALRVTMTHTQTANELKKVGGLIIGELVTQFTVGLDLPFSKDPKGNRKDLVLGSGKVSREHLMRSAYSDVRWIMKSKLSNMSRSDTLSLIDFRKLMNDFMYYPQPFDEPGDIFVGFFKGEPKIKPSSKFVDAGFDVEFSFEESISA